MDAWQPRQPLAFANEGGRVGDKEVEGGAEDEAGRKKEDAA